MTERKQWGWGGGGKPEVNNLVYTKRRKDIYANRKHETTVNDVTEFVTVKVAYFKRVLGGVCQTVFKKGFF